MNKIESIVGNLGPVNIQHRTLVTKIPVGWLVTRFVISETTRTKTNHVENQLSNTTVLDENHTMDPKDFFFSFEKPG